MRGNNQFFKLGQVADGGFQNQKDFGTAFNFSLPAIMGLDLWNEVGASNEPRLQRGAGKAAGRFQVRRGDEDDPEVRGFHGNELHRRLRFDDVKMIAVVC